MSGREIVRAMRENVAFSKPQRRFGLLDVALTLVALAAVICCGAIAISKFGIFTRPMVPMPPSTLTANAERPTWGSTDDATCEVWVRKAQREDDTSAFPLADQAITGGGYAALAARLDCHASVKVARLCDPAEKAALVAQINDFLSRRDLLSLGLDVQGAPMKVVGTMMGGEAEMGSSVYDMSKSETLDYMAMHDQRVIDSLRSLGTAGILSTADFGLFGYGVPDTIEDIFKGVSATAPLCG